jgi:diguanylate cyclase (GGDEF)-like protein
MMAQGEAMGLVVLRKDPQATESSPLELARMSEPRRQLAVATAAHISMALANAKLRETLRNQSIRDPLTGLFNRRYMEETLERELHRAARKGVPVGIIMADLDHFKRFNDTFGHLAGDALLRMFGELLASRIRSEDVACRYGGEEFALILPEASLETTRERAEEVREQAKSLQAQLRGQSLGGVTVSLGVAAFPQHGSTAEAVLHTADAALYRAKAEGRDRVIVAEGSADKS